MEYTQACLEYHFENVTTLNPAMYAETLRKTRKFYLVFALLMAGWMIYTIFYIWVAYTQNIIALNLIGWFVFYLAAFIFALLLPKIHTRKAMRALQREAGGQPIVTTRQFGERITTYRLNGISSLDYCNIKKVYSFKTCYVIRFMDNIAVMILSRDGFTKGTFEEFKQFLRTKRPDLKIPE